MKAADVLDTAKKLILGDRAEAYGDALDLHQKVAEHWTQTLTLAGMKPEKPLDAHVVAWMMADLKKVRAFQSPDHDDSYVDAAGYVSLAAQLK